LSNWHDSNFHEVPVDPFQEETGIAVDVPENPSALDLFSLYFHLETFQHMADETNKYAEWVQQQRGKVDATWKPTSAEEMKAFVGCTIMMAINSLPVLHMYWMQDPFLRNDGITAVFTRDRYKKISQYFHLNDNTKQKKKGEDGYDILYKIQPILDMCTTTFQTVVKPAKELSVDEGMIKYKGRVSFLQYMPKKPVKRGIKAWIIAGSSTGIVLRFSIYIGRGTDFDSSDDELQTVGTYLGERVVFGLTRNYHNKGHHIFMDNFFNSPQLLEALLRQKTYGCGTVILSLN
jgi:hypothetical protein